MKLLRHAFRLLNTNHSEGYSFALNRLFSDAKVMGIEEIKEHPKQNVEDNQRHDRFDRKGISITAYNEIGFRLNLHIQLIGPIIVFPRTVFSWNVENCEQINSDSLMIFGLVQPRIETLIIGTGDYDNTSNINKNIIEMTHKHKINVEILTTELACTQFNYLNSEGRMIAAALIPPQGMRTGEDDIFNTPHLNSNLYTIDNIYNQDNK